MRAASDIKMMLLVLTFYRLACGADHLDSGCRVIVIMLEQHGMGTGTMSKEEHQQCRQEKPISCGKPT